MTLIRADKTRQIFGQERVAFPRITWQPFFHRKGICFPSHYKAEARMKFLTVRQPEQSLEDVGKSELRVFITVFAPVFLNMKLAKFLVLSVALLCLASLVSGQNNQGRYGGFYNTYQIYQYGHGYGGFYNTYQVYRYGHGYYTGKQISRCILNLQFVDFVVVKLYMLVNLLKRC